MSKSKQRSKKKPVESPLSKWVARWGFLALGMLAFLIYANTLGHEFVLDDAIVITENSFTQQGLSGLKSIFGNDSFRGFFQEDGKENLVAGGRYRPFSLAMFAVEFALFGKNPFPGHLITVLFYCLLCMIVFRVLSNLLQGHARDATLVAFLAALIFTCHPVHTEVVANIKSRDEIMAMLFGMLSMHLMLRHILKPDWRFALAGSGFLLLALLSKEIAVLFMVLIPLAGLLLKRVAVTPLVVRSLPMLIPFALFMILRISAVGWGGVTDPPMELMNNPFLVFVEGHYEMMPWIQKSALVIIGLGKYLQLSLFPIVLSYDYYPRYFQTPSSLDWRVVLTMVCYSILLVLALLQRKKKPLFSFSILWYLLPLLLVANIFFPIGTHISERFLFLPSLGVALAIASVLYHWFEKTRYPHLPRVLLAVLVSFAAFHSMQRNAVWKSNYTLFTQDLRHAGQSAKARNSAAGALIDQALQEEAPQKDKLLQLAKQYLEEALQIHPHYKNAHLLLGNAHLYLREFELALTHYQDALALDPDYAEALNNQAVAHREFGKYWGEEKQNIDQAIHHLLEAHTYLKQDFETIRLLGVAYGNSGNHARAVEYFEKAHEISPNDVVVVRSLQTVYTALGQRDRAQYFAALVEKMENQSQND